jgi:hypothetical protein
MTRAEYLRQLGKKRRNREELNQLVEKETNPITIKWLRAEIMILDQNAAQQERFLRGMDQDRAVVAALKEALPKLGGRDHTFAQSLIGQADHPGLSNKQLYWAERLAIRAGVQCPRLRT